MAAAASVSIGVFPEDIQIYRSQLMRSQAWKANWITVDLGGASVQGDQGSSFAAKTYARTQISYRHEWNHWGLMAAFRSETEDQTLMETIKTTENVSIFSLGATHRWFLFSDPLTFWGQSHFVVHALAESVQAKYKLSDNYTGSSDTASTFGSNVGAAYYLPLYWGFWIDLGVDYETHPYKYNNPLVNLNMNHNLLSGYIGASYAF